MAQKNKYLTIIWAILVIAFAPVILNPAISIAGGVNVKILYDFSGSMYPGYPDHRRYDSGEKYFHQYDHFRDWLESFVRMQTRFNAKNVSMSIFRSERQFQPGDITQTHPPAPPRRFDVKKAFDILRPGGVDYTYLAESLDHFTGKNFEGLVWMITDNRVEQGEGEGGTTRDFFISLRDTGRYRSIHIFKLPFEKSTSGQKANLAIYGILVSPKSVPHKVLRWYDQRFFELKNTFKERQHLKLKDLSVDPIRINIERIEVDIEAFRKAVTEGKNVMLKLTGKIYSMLTQHTIIGGTLLIEPKGAFAPDTRSKEEYGIKEIPAKQFKNVTLNIDGEIPPMGVKTLTSFYLESKKPISLDISGMGSQIKAATSGVSVKYSGKGRVSSKKIDITIKKEGRKRITGIYSSGDIEPIFGTQATIAKIKANPSEFDINFTVKSGAGRGLLFLMIILALMVPFVIAWFLLRQKETYRIRKGSSEEMASLARLGGYRITENGLLLGTLKRGLGPADNFIPNGNLASITVTPGKKNNEFNVVMDDLEKKKSFKLTIEPVSSSRSITGKFETETSSRLGHPKPQHAPKPVGPSIGDPSRKPKKKAVIRPPR